MRPNYFAAFALVSALLASSACGSGFSAGAGGTGGSGGQVQSQAGTNAAAGSGGSLPPSGGAGGMSVGGSGGTAANGGASNLAGAAGGAGIAGASAGGSAGAPASECPCAAPTPTCELGRCVVRGPSMVKANGFYIDSTEVTSGQYAAFEKAKNGDTSGQAPECSWNLSFDPLFDPKAAMPTLKEPVTNVDFCDAAAFCAWADKRLCGKIGGGDLQLAELADPTKSQWFEACAGPLAQPYPYGATYQSGYCNDASGAGTLVDVGSKTQCQGYYPGLFDMLGNAQEWTGTCMAKSGMTDGCERIGGSYKTTTQCSESGLAQRNLQAAELGFRCCSK